MVDAWESCYALLNCFSNVCFRPAECRAETARALNDPPRSPTNRPPSKPTLTCRKMSSSARPILSRAACPLTAFFRGGTSGWLAVHCRMRAVNQVARDSQRLFEQFHKPRLKSIAPVEFQDPIHIFGYGADDEALNPILFGDCQQPFYQVSAHVPVSILGPHVNVFYFQIRFLLSRQVRSIGQPVIRIGQRQIAGLIEPR
jgi:hypothetical protein